MRLFDLVKNIQDANVEPLTEEEFASFVRRGYLDAQRFARRELTLKTMTNCGVSGCEKHPLSGKAL